MPRIDTHVHSTFSVRDSNASLPSIIRRCQKMGLDHLCITDHNTTKGGMEMQRIAPFPVIVGEEVMSTHGEIIGLFMKADVPRGLSPLETVKRIKGQDGLVFLPHPFDVLRHGLARHGVETIEQLLPYVDAMEAYNAACMRELYNRQAEEFVQKHKLLGVSASDAHFITELGYTYTELPEFEMTPQGLLTALKSAKLVKRHILFRDRAMRTYRRFKRMVTGRP